MDEYKVKVTYSEDEVARGSGIKISDRIIVKYPDCKDPPSLREYVLDRDEAKSDNIILELALVIARLQESKCDPKHERKLGKIKQDFRELKNMKLVMEILKDFISSEDEQKSKAGSMIVKAAVDKVTSVVMGNLLGEKKAAS